tara:strand:- start:271 stop:1359 length:1089 start_codon:yes stop_codon:yes gene_type:complete
MLLLKAKISNNTASIDHIILKSVSNPSSVHGIYPYRGKISAKDAISVIAQLSPNRTLLDPFCGTGTILYEAQKFGMDVIGVDPNPLANIVSKGKMSLQGLDKEKTLDEVESIIKKAKSLKKVKKLPVDAEKGFHSDTADQIMRVKEFYNEMSDYLKSIFCGSICISARGCNNYIWTSTTVGKNTYPKRFINFYEKFTSKAKKHFYKLENKNKCTIYSRDARTLSKFIKPNSVDYVFTSPPYFDGLDYTAYYAKFVYPILEIDRISVKKNLIQSLKTYEIDMQKCLNEIVKITKNDALIIFVVGDKKIKNQTISGGDFFSELLHHKPNQIIERQYSGSASQVFDKINKTNRKEQIVVWDKSTW